MGHSDRLRDSHLPRVKSSHFARSDQTPAGGPPVSPRRPDTTNKAPPSANLTTPPPRAYQRSAGSRFAWPPAMSRLRVRARHLLRRRGSHRAGAAALVVARPEAAAHADVGAGPQRVVRVAGVAVGRAAEIISSAAGHRDDAPLIPWRGAGWRDPLGPARVLAGAPPALVQAGLAGEARVWVARAAHPPVRR